MVNFINSNILDVLAGFTKIKNWLLPSACVLCQTKTAELDLCAACKAELPWLMAHCKHCALPLNSTTDTCGECLKQPPAFDNTYALFLYQQPIDTLIKALKFRNKLVYARLFSELLFEHLKTIYSGNQSTPDCIVPIPLHSTRLRERGFNQATEIARSLSKKFKRPLDLTSCHRIKATLAQTSLPAHQRQKNLKNAFEVTPKISGFKHIALIDDVVTTGQTVRELSSILKSAGVDKIDIWCCARTAL